MNYALASPRTRLAVRQNLAEQILVETQAENWGSLRDNPSLVYVLDDLWVEGFCIYCNTAVYTYDNNGHQRFKHNWQSGGIPQGYCRQIGEILGMTPVYPYGVVREEED